MSLAGPDQGVGWGAGRLTGKGEASDLRLALFHLEGFQIFTTAHPRCLLPC